MQCCCNLLCRKWQKSWRYTKSYRHGWLCERNYAGVQKHKIDSYASQGAGTSSTTGFITVAMWNMHFHMFSVLQSAQITTESTMMGKKIHPLWTPTEYCELQLKPQSRRCQRPTEQEKNIPCKCKLLLCLVCPKCNVQPTYFNNLLK